MSIDLEGFDSSEKEIIEREIAEGRASLSDFVRLHPKIVTEDETARRERLSRELHEQIVNGKIDAGSVTIHKPVERDIRDLRDPALLGDAYLLDRSRGALPSTAAFCNVDNYSGEPVRYYEHYQAELRERAAAGDRFAKSVLETGQPGDSDE